MNIQRWVAQREPNWKRLNALLKRVENQGIKSLKTSEIKELASLYRSVSADLARAQTTQVGPTLIQNLQNLTSRSYSQIYQGSRRQEWQAVVQFYRQGFPNIVQQTWGYTMLATAIFLLGAIAAWWYAWQDPIFVSLLELPAIFLAGGAGLLLAKAILFPGRYRRADALKYYGSQAAQLIFGIVPLLVVAGVIEGFFSPSPLVPNPVKYLVGLVLFALLVLYCSHLSK